MQMYLQEKILRWERLIQSHGYGDKKGITDSEKLQASLPPSCAYYTEILGASTSW